MESTQETRGEDAHDLEQFLIRIGYLQPDRPVDFEMSTPQLDPDMDQNGPELVTPVSNASMAVGGANARWGSLYDAYFLSDVHPGIDRQEQRPARLRMVVEETNAFLDQHVAQWNGADGIGDITSFSVMESSGRYELVGEQGAARHACKIPAGSSDSTWATRGISRSSTSSTTASAVSSSSTKAARSVRRMGSFETCSSNRQ